MSHTACRRGSLVLALLGKDRRLSADLNVRGWDGSELQRQVQPPGRSTPGRPARFWALEPVMYFRLY